MARKPHSDFVLDDQICFALYSASRAMTAAYRAGLAALGLTYTQYVVLLLLWEHDDLTMGQLSERLHLDSATLSPLLKRLASLGLIERRRRQSDERVVEVKCTEAGRALRERVSQVQAEVEVATGLGGAELAALRDDLHAMAARLRAFAQGDVSGMPHLSL